MAEARIEWLTRLLGGQLPPKLIEYAPVEVVTSHTNTNDDTNDKPATVSVAAENEHDRVALAAGPLSSRMSVARSIRTTLIEPERMPQISQRGELDTNTDPRCGEPAPLGLQFCPFLAVAKMPYKFVDKEYSQPVATAFFDAEKIWNREWDLYYAWSDDCPNPQPVTFVSVVQFQVLVDEINTAFPGLDWTFTDKHKERGLLIDFSSSNTNLRPCWLGRSNCRNRHEFLRGKVSKQSKKILDTDQSDLLTFQEHIELAVDVARNKPKRSKNQGQHIPESTMIKQTAASVQLKHAYLYLGLAQAVSAVDTEKPILRNEDVIFIAIDIEAYERDHSKPTEVGISTLDTRDLQHMAMGQGGREWRKAIRARHFVVHEHKHLVNHAFVRGCPDSFDFGTSETVALADLPKILTSCLHHPYSKPGDEGTSDEQRKIVLVGHDINQDIKYCHQFGFSILHRSSIVEVIDTATMYRAFTKDSNPRSLASIMLAFDLDAWNTHNAGNDAVYTLWALLGMCCGAYLKLEEEDIGNISTNIT